MWMFIRSKVNWILKRNYLRMKINDDCILSVVCVIIIGKVVKEEGRKEYQSNTHLWLNN